MTITECLKSIERRYEHSTDYYDATSEDFLLRMGLANDKINMWEREAGSLWRELYTSSTGTLDADGEDLITDLHMPSGKIVVDGSYYDYLSPELVQESQRIEPTTKIYTILGGQMSRTVKVYPNPGAVAYSMPYFKAAHQYTDGADTTEIEMSDPYFIVHSVCGDLFMDDGDQDRASIEIQIAAEKMSAMRMQNESVPVHTDQYTKDYEFNGFGN